MVTALGDHLSATTTDSTPVFSGTSEPNSSIEVYSEVGPSNANPPVPYCATFAAASGTWSCGSTSGFAPGVWTFGVVGVDALNNPSTTDGPDAQLDLTINAPNAPVISSPADGSTTYDPTATVTGTATDSVGGVVTVNGPSSTVCSATVLPDGSWSCSGSLIQGIQTLSATVVNVAGTISGTASINVQLGAPGPPTFTAPAANSTTIDDTVTFSGLANAGLGGNVNVSISGTPACSAAVDGATGDWTCSTEVPRGTLVVQAIQQDSFGVDGLPSSESFTANSPTPPIITSPADGSTTMNPQVTFSGTATGFAGGILTVLDGESTACTTTVHPSSFWQCTATLAIGAHFIGVSAVDAANTFSPTAFETVTVIPLQVPPTIPKPPAAPTLPAAPPTTPPVSFDWSLHVFDTAGDDLTGGTAPAGTALLLTGGGIPAGYTSDAVLHSVPVDLGSELIDNSGTYAIPTEIPADTPPGAHDIIVTTTGPSGDTSTRDVPITVTAPADSSIVSPAVAPLPKHPNSVGHATSAAMGVASASAYSTALKPFSGITITPVGLAITGATTASILIFVALPSELLESTVRENYALMFGWLTPARRRYDSWRARFRRLAIPPAVTSVAVVVASSVILGFSSPEFGFNGASLRLLIALFISLAVINVGIPAIVRLVARTRLNVGSSLTAMPATLLLVAASVLLSRALGVEPGFLFGVVLGVNFAVQLSRRREALLALLGIWLSMGVGVICWLAYSAIVSADIKDPGFWVLLAQEALVTTTAEAMATLVISVLPLEFLDGKTIWKWSRGAWAGTYAVALIIFIVVILPSSDEMGKVSATEWGWGAAFLAFAVLAVGLWVGFQLRKRRSGEPTESEHF